MHDQSSYESLRQKSWLQPLNRKEQEAIQAILAGNPEAQSDWEAEAALTQALNQLSDVPVSSNFTARVLQAAEREAVQRHHPRPRLFHWLGNYGVRNWLPRAAFAAVLVGAGIFSWMHLENEQQNRISLVRSLATVSQAAPLADPEILRDFDAIMVMKQQPAADEELLRLMQ